jgi:hypothetical protein
MVLPTETRLPHHGIAAEYVDAETSRAEAGYSPKGSVIVQQGELTTRSNSSDRVASSVERSYDANMTTPTREEIDATLETAEVRMDGRVAAIEANINGFMGRIEERSLRTDDRFVRIENGLKETQASIRSLKTTMIVTAISSVLAIVFGIAAINATLLSNMVASFESGRNVSAAQAEVRRQAEETAVLLKQLQDRMPLALSATPERHREKSR